MEPEAMWLLYSGVKLIATKLSRTALKLEQEHERLSSEADRTLVRPRIQDVYAMVDEASKLLPLFRRYADTLASGPADTPATGFQSLPTEVQQKILALAAADNDTAAALRRVSRSFEAHAWTAVHSRTTINLANITGVTLLPYLPRLGIIQCSRIMDLPSTRFVDAVVTAQLPAWPNLVSLRLLASRAHTLQFTQLLSSASHLTQLYLGLAFRGAAIPGGDWPHTLALALPQLQNLQWLTLFCRVPTGCPEPYLCQHLSALTHLTGLAYLASPSDDGGTAVVAHGLSGLTSLSTLELVDWPSRATAADRSAWSALVGSISSLHSLDNLRFVEWQLDTSSSAAYLAELAPALTSLHALTHLVLNVDEDVLQTAPNPAAAASSAATNSAATNSAAGAALVQAIGSLAQLLDLELAALKHVAVCACCQYLSSLTSLTRLKLQSLGVTEQPTPDAPEPHAAPGGTFVQLLGGMTRLEDLTLDDVGLSGRSAMRVFSAVVPTMVHLQTLWLPTNQLGVALTMVLATSVRQLPALHYVYLGWGNDLVEPHDGVLGTIADLNLITGRDIFE